MSGTVSGGPLSDARFDHVAIAVPERATAERVYVDLLGAGRVALARHGGIEIEQLRFANGCKLELLSPDGDRAGAARLTEHVRAHPSALHHVTLLVDSLDDAVAGLAASGVRCVGVADQPDGSREAFVLPRDAAGVLVQLVWKDVSDDEWARRRGQVAQDAAAGAARFLGARYAHPDLALAAGQLRRLGAQVETAPGRLAAWWDDTGLRLWLVHEPAPVELVFVGAAPRPADPAVGPAIVVESTEP